MELLDLQAPERTQENVGRVHIEEALRMTEGNVSEAARVLGIGQGSIRRKMECFNFSRQAIVYPSRQSRGLSVQKRTANRAAEPSSGEVRGVR